jgi:hypothetical protein
VGSRLNPPPIILHPRARHNPPAAPPAAPRGNILAWEQHLADRLDGQPVQVVVEMETGSILYSTLWLFAGAFTTALAVLALLIWWTMRKGRDKDPIDA